MARPSYETPGFSAFYEALLETLPPEYEPGVDVSAVYWPILKQQLQAFERGTATVLDLCCGSGRVALALRKHFAAWPNRRSDSQLKIVGVDSSDEMLSAARSVQDLAHTKKAGPGAADCPIDWVRGDMANLVGMPELEHLHGTCNLVIISAGSFHHLLTKADQLSCLRGVAAMLSAGGSGSGAGDRPPSLAVLNLFDSTHLQAAPGEAAVLREFRRTCLQQERVAQADGGFVWTQRFQLERYSSPEAAAVQDGGKLSWSQVEQWSLREVAPEHLRRLADDAGLSVVRQQARWSAGWDAASEHACVVADARIFVLALQQA